MPFNRNATHTVADIDTYNDVAGNQYITTVQSNDTNDRDAAILSKLNPVDHNRRYVPPCMKGTREDIFHKIYQWLDDPNSDKNIMWITGNPGAGKSAIASSLVSQLREVHRLGGSFAFLRGDLILSDPAVVWRTVASQLASFDPNIATTIASALKNGTVDPQRPGIDNHFMTLIKSSLLAIDSQNIPESYPIVVIDALDECSGTPQDPQRRVFLDTLIEWSILSKTMKLIVTGRDTRLPNAFRQKCETIILGTGDEVSLSTCVDIQMFFEARFLDLKADLPSLADWPAASVITQLTARAAGLFIWAETVMRFIEDDPRELLSYVVEGGVATGDNDVYHLYQQIAAHALANIKKRKHGLTALQPLLRTIVFAKAPLPREYLKDFLDVTVPDTAIDLILRDFKSVISITDGRVRVGHLSFMEFLLDYDDCPSDLCIPREAGVITNKEILRACLRIMDDSNCGLKFNICMLETSYLRNADVADLDDRIKKYIPGHLYYACRYWGPHLIDAASILSACQWFTVIMRTFFTAHLLQWPEVMSVTHQTRVALVMLDAVASALHGISELTAYAQDGWKFIAHFEVPISESVPHIYISALPLAPEQSWLSQTYLPYFQKTLKVECGKDHWTTLLKTLQGHSDSVTSVAFSPSRSWIASGSHDKTVRIWDVTTGDVVGILHGHQEGVYSVAFSPDGSKLASGSVDKTIRIWDSVSSEVIHSLGGPKFGVTSVAFPPDGSGLVSASQGKTIRIWEIVFGHFNIEGGH